MTTKELKFCGWGYEGEGLNAARRPVTRRQRWNGRAIHREGETGRSSGRSCNERWQVRSHRRRCADEVNQAAQPASTNWIHRGASPTSWVSIGSRLPVS